MVFPDQTKTFKRFVTNKSNRFARSVLTSTIQNLFGPYRFVIIYGTKSTGKSHLLNVFANDVIAVDSGFRPFLIELNDFPELLNCDTESLAKSDIKIFCIEDLDQIHAEPDAFNWLTEALLKINEANGQLVITCNVEKLEIRTLSEWADLFSCSIMADIAPYGFIEHREILLEASADARSLSTDVVDFIVSSSARDIDQMKAAIGILTRFSSLRADEITIDMARDAIQFPA